MLSLQFCKTKFDRWNASDRKKELICDVDYVTKVICTVLSKDGALTFGKKLKGPYRALHKFFNVMQWCTRGRMTVGHPGSGSEMYVAFETLCFLIAHLCREDPETSRVAVSVAAEFLIEFVLTGVDVRQVSYACFAITLEGGNRWLIVSSMHIWV